MSEADKEQEAATTSMRFSLRSSARALVALGAAALVCSLTGCDSRGTAEKPAGKAGSPPARGAAADPGGPGAPAPGGKGKPLDVVSTTPAYEFHADLVSRDPLVAETVREMWERSILARDLLPQVVARVNGEEITYRDLAVECVTRFGDEALMAFVRELVVLEETAGRGLEITDDEIEETIGEILDGSVKIRKKDLYYMRKKVTPAYLRLKARARKGIQKAFVSDAGKDRFNPDEDLLAIGVYQDAFFQRYEIRTLTEWGPWRLGEGVAATVNGVAIPLDAALPIVLARICDDQLDQSLEDLIQATLARQGFERKGIRLDPADGDLLLARRRASGYGAIPWEAIIRTKGKFDPLKTESIAWIRRKFDIWFGLDKLLGAIDELQTVEYFRNQQTMIGRGAVKVAYFRIMTVDPGSCRRRNPEGLARAARNADKALQELRGGGDFATVLGKYADAVETRRNVETEVHGEKVRVTGAVRSSNIRDSSLPDEVAAAAFLTPEGEWIGPVRTRNGYVFLEVLGTRAPVAFPYDSEPYEDVNGNGRRDDGEPFQDVGLQNGVWDSGRKGFAYNELRGDRAAEWIDGLRARAKIEILR